MSWTQLQIRIALYWKQLFHAYIQSSQSFARVCRETKLYPPSSEITKQHKIISYSLFGSYPIQILQNLYILLHMLKVIKLIVLQSAIIKNNISQMSFQFLFYFVFLGFLNNATEVLKYFILKDCFNHWVVLQRITS